MSAHPEFLAGLNLAGVRFIDLTHPMHPGMPVWPTHPPFQQELIESYDRGDIACNHALCLSEHSGTHFDAPLHFFKDGTAIGDVPVERFFGRLVTIQALDCCPDEAIGIERIAAFEAEHGIILSGDAVLFHFGWDGFWDDPALRARFLRDWPGLSEDICILLKDRGVRMVGSDCLSIDCFGSTDFPAHNVLLGAGILVGENFANLGLLPAFSFLVALPLPILSGSGAPTRAVALIQQAGTDTVISGDNA